MIKAVLIINNHGKPRLASFYEHFDTDKQQQIIRECFNLVSKRSDRSCNFLEGGSIWGKDTKLIYRHYATLFFIFCVDASESELGILDLFRCLSRHWIKISKMSVSWIIFHMDKVHYVLDEIVMGGMVLETNLPDIIEAIESQNKLEKNEDVFSGLKDVLNRVQR